MRLYPKELRGINDLEREKALLKLETRALDSEDLFSLEGLLGKKKTPAKKGGKKKEQEEGNDEGGFDLSSLIDLIPTGSGNPLIGIALNFIKTKAAKAGLNAGKNILLRVGKEVVLGYLKWKAIELAAKGVSSFIKKQKEKRAS